MALIIPTLSLFLFFFNASDMLSVCHMVRSWGALGDAGGVRPTTNSADLINIYYWCLFWPAAICCAPSHCFNTLLMSWLLLHYVSYLTVIREEILRLRESVGDRSVNGSAGQTTVMSQLRGWILWMTWLMMVGPSKDDEGWRSGYA